MDSSLKSLTIELAFFYRLKPDISTGFKLGLQEAVKELDNNKGLLLPIPENEQTIPRLHLKSANDEIQVQSSSEKLGIFFRLDNPKTSIEGKHLEIANKILSSTVLDGVTYKRVGYIKFFAHSMKKPVEFIGAKTLQKSATKDLREYSLQLVYDENFLDYECNRVVQITNEHIEGVRIGVDLNTKVKDNLTMSRGQAVSFIENASSYEFISAIQGVVGKAYGKEEQ